MTSETGSKKFETTVLRGILQPLRLFANTRVKDKGRPKTLRASIVRDKNPEETLLHPSEFPWLAITYKLIPPRAFLGTPPDFSRKDIWFDIDVIPNPNRGLIKWDGNPNGLYSNAKMRVIFHPFEFCQMIAKIAYCFAISEYGIDAIDTFIPQLILGKFPDANYFVGFPCETPDIMSAFQTKCQNGLPENGHGIGVVLQHWPNGVVQIRCLVALFVEFNYPIYEVFIGNLRE